MKSTAGSSPSNQSHQFFGSPDAKIHEKVEFVEVTSESTSGSSTSQPSYPDLALNEQFRVIIGPKGSGKTANLLHYQQSLAKRRFEFVWSAEFHEVRAVSMLNSVLRADRAGLLEFWRRFWDYVLLVTHYLWYINKLREHASKKRTDRAAIRDEVDQLVNQSKRTISRRTNHEDAKVILGTVYDTHAGEIMLPRNKINPVNVASRILSRMTTPLVATEESQFRLAPAINQNIAVLKRLQDTEAFSNATEELTSSRFLKGGRQPLFILDGLDQHWDDCPVDAGIFQCGLIATLYSDLADLQSNRSKRKILASTTEMVTEQMVEAGFSTKILGSGIAIELDWNWDCLREFFRERLDIALSEKPGSRKRSDAPIDELINEWLTINEIENLDRARVDDQSSKPIERTEKIADYIMRHTRIVPRDLVEIVNAIDARLHGNSHDGNPVQLQHTIRDVVSVWADRFGREMLQLVVERFFTMRFASNPWGLELLFASVEVAKEGHAENDGASITRRRLSDAINRMNAEKFTGSDLRSVLSNFAVAANLTTHDFDAANVAETFAAEMMRLGAFGEVADTSSSTTVSYFINEPSERIDREARSDRFSSRFFRWHPCLIDTCEITKIERSIPLPV